MNCVFKMKMILETHYYNSMLLKRLFGHSKEGDAEPYIQWYNTEKPPKASDYIKKRLELQLNWYDNKAKDNMYRYHKLQILIIGASVLIPIVNVVDGADGNDLIVRIVSSILGSMIVGATGILQLTKAQESWIVFRSTAETLKKEYNLYMLKAGDYSDSSLSDDKRDILFIERSESIMAMEGTKYFSLRRKSEPSTKNQA
jgi:hypothetical protein